MASRDPRVDAYIKNALPFARPVFIRLRTVVHAACPDVEEDVKWRHPAFMHNGILCGLAGFKAYCALMFWKEALLKPRLSKADVAALERLSQLTSVEDLPADRTIARIVKAAAALNDEGVKAPPRAKPPKDRRVELPPFLTDALAGAPTAKAAFDAFSYSHQKEYVEWLSDAKTDATRARRLETALTWLAEGKPRNWKYM